MKSSNNYISRGFTMIEMMIVACVITILALVGFANFGRYSEKTNRQEATALLSQYYSYAKSASAEFLCNPGNFVSLGFNPVGQIKSRILAAPPPAPCTLPLGYPNNNNDCISTAFDKTHTEDGGTECRDPPIPTPLDEYYFPSWTETASMDDVANNECPDVNGVNVTAVNDGDKLTFRTLACLRGSSKLRTPAVACICHNGVIGGNEEACSKDDCKQP